MLGYPGYFLARAGGEPWLDDGQQESWRAVIGLLTVLPAALDSDLRRTAGLTMFEYTVLASLSEAPERTLQMSALAARAIACLHGSPTWSPG